MLSESFGCSSEKSTTYVALHLRRLFHWIDIIVLHFELYETAQLKSHEKLSTESLYVIARL